MRSHPEVNKKVTNSVMSLIDIKQAAWVANSDVSKVENINFDGAPLYKISGEDGLFTMAELRLRFLN